MCTGACRAAAFKAYRELAAQRHSKRTGSAPRSGIHSVLGARRAAALCTRRLGGVRRNARR
eukprot:13495977-Heterocapsa_arctica.AAC.1